LDLKIIFSDEFQKVVFGALNFFLFWLEVTLPNSHHEILHEKDKALVYSFSWSNPSFLETF
jgi:hypothetical protein